MSSSRLRKCFIFVSVILLLFACHQRSAKDESKNIPAKEMDVYETESISDMFSDADKKNNKIDDSIHVFALTVLNNYYAGIDFKPIWNSKGTWKPATDSLLSFLKHCEWNGLFKQDYQYKLLDTLVKSLRYDSLKKMTPHDWARADILLSDAFVHVLQDTKQGRLQPDSLGWKNNKEKQNSFFNLYLDSVQMNAAVSHIVSSLEPSVREYAALKKGIPAFLDSMDTKKYTYLYYPNKDSIGFLKRLLVRLAEAGIETDPIDKLDSSKLSEALSKYQKAKGIKPTGKISAPLVNILNNTGQERFKRIAITLDRYKQIPDPMPEKYIWVNLPSFYLQVWEKDSLVMESKVIVGKQDTQTPEISSEISDLVIYPTWTVPNSIIVKDILPGLKKNPDYLSRKGLGLFDNKGDPVDPHLVKWTKYTKGMPYMVRQSSGDNNALGVIKFNFNNPYSVYLHDTNQRYLFKNGSRSLSHGCVRVQDWQKLAFYIVRNDSLNSSMPDSLRLTTDSISSWIAQKQKHVMGISQRLPVFIRYFSCAGIKNSVKFYEDIYNRDKAMRDKYFSLK